MLKPQFHSYKKMKLGLAKFKNEREPSENFSIHRAIILEKCYEQNCQRSSDAIKSALKRTRLNL